MVPYSEIIASDDGLPTGAPIAIRAYGPKPNSDTTSESSASNPQSYMSPKKNMSTSIAGIAGGVVLLVIIAIGGFFLHVRRRRRKRRTQAQSVSWRQQEPTIKAFTPSTQPVPSEDIDLRPILKTLHGPASPFTLSRSASQETFTTTATPTNTSFAVSIEIDGKEVCAHPKSRPGLPPEGLYELDTSDSVAYPAAARKKSRFEHVDIAELPATSSATSPTVRTSQQSQNVKKRRATYENAVELPATLPAAHPLRQKSEFQ